MTERNKLLQQRIENHIIRCIRFTNQLPVTVSNKPIISQLIRAITSIGANYQEACEAESARDFTHKISITKKEAKETLYWLRLLYRTNASLRKEISVFGQETTELIKIFSAIILKFR